MDGVGVSLRGRHYILSLLIPSYYYISRQLKRTTCFSQPGSALLDSTYLVIRLMRYDGYSLKIPKIFYGPSTKYVIDITLFGYVFKYFHISIFQKIWSPRIGLSVVYLPYIMLCLHNNIICVLRNNIALLDINTK